MVVANMSMSLDKFIAGPNDDVVFSCEADNPLSTIVGYASCTSFPAYRSPSETRRSNGTKRSRTARPTLSRTTSRQRGS